MARTKAKWNRNNIRELLQTNDKAVIRGLMVLYSFQTADEQNIGLTVEENGMGFNGADAEILTSFAQFYERTGRLSDKQLEIARSKILKYAGQIAGVANQNEREKQERGDA